jgi:hypothetical protein
VAVDFATSTFQHIVADGLFVVVEHNLQEIKCLLELR